MSYDPNTHHRQSLRLQDYDYTQAGAYFVTICSAEREPLFGSIGDAGMVLSAQGEIVRKWWHAVPVRFPNVELDTYVVMLNHLHGIIVLSDGVGATRWVARLN